MPVHLAIAYRSIFNPFFVSALYIFGTACSISTSLSCRIVDLLFLHKLGILRPCTFPFAATMYVFSFYVFSFSV